MDDPELSALLQRETAHYLGVVDLIAASNAPTLSVRASPDLGVAQFRSAEGYPGRRPYAGTRLFDEIEELAIDRARTLFAAEHANVQPQSGSLANLAAYRAAASPGARILAMSMRDGGHLSHSHERHLVTSMYEVSTYGVDPSSGLIDYDQVRKLAHQVRPHILVAGSSAYPRTIEFAEFAEIAHEVGAVFMADISHIAGLVAVGLHPNPVQFGAIVTTSVEKTLRGTRGGLLLCPSDWARRVDSAVHPGIQSSVGLAHLASLAALLREALTVEYAAYQHQVVAHAQRLAAGLSLRELALVAGGTDTHMLIVRVADRGLTGRQAEERLEEIGILSNRNLIPGDSLPPREASGLRLGTSTIAARGFLPDEVDELADIISVVLLADDWDALLRDRLRSRVAELAGRSREGDTLRDLQERSAVLVGQR